MFGGNSENCLCWRTIADAFQFLLNSSATVHREASCAGMRMLEKYGVTANELRVVGGGSKNRLWRRIIADAFQLPLRFPAEPESAALGGALQAAAVCAGVPVAEYVAENEPPCEEEVSISPFRIMCSPDKQDSSFNCHILQTLWCHNSLYWQVLREGAAYCTASAAQNAH